ncbi:M81 family metallopeptidase [Dactylosporangium sp. AC04546]|uniref:M81 family metallopeptidase n=1 Tax=Dactylosporangium sp. AC04546 TaxID=2862460 RepID=UPI001EDEF765|nr:M81 family metallopeptidase [Dactylosporangium sp. AC04546]WVK81048.1 M81 family metallopeptidase [Dactylosporangium sp. AC04546]
MTLPRVAVLGLWHETNTYGPNPADLAAFEAFELVTGDDVRRHHAGDRSVISGFLAAPGLDAVPVFSAGAWPSGPAPAETLATLLDRLTEALAAAAPFDGVLLNLHGAMVAAATPDVEAVLLRRVRAIVGDVPVAAVLDLHANPSAAFVGACDIVLAYDTYPHVDMFERGHEAATLLAEAIGGRPLTTVLARVPLLTCPLAQSTDAEPMRGLIARARDRAAEAGLARVSLTPGFAYSDVDRAGIGVLVVAGADQADAARRVANEIAGDIEVHAEEFALRRPGVEAAVREALAADVRPVVLADVADNIGGGSPGDGTALLAALIAADAPDAVVVIADAEVARRAASLGTGASLVATVGAKADARHGTPVELEAEILAVTDGGYTTEGSWMTGQSFSMGTTAVLRQRGVRVVVTERATPPFHREHLTSVGIDPASVAVIVAKGAVAWRSAFPDVALAIEVATPGVCPVDVASLPRSTAPARVVA